MSKRRRNKLVTELNIVYHHLKNIIISFQDIFSVCEFEVSNAYFSLNCVIFLQLLGCPQGGPGSPGFSMVVCIFYEHQFRCSIYDHLAFIFFFHYFDDLRAVVIHRSSDITSKSLAFSLLDKLQTQTYHPSMSLKSVRKTRLNFLKENLLLQMILCLVSGCQKTLTHSNNMAR